jgi:hypothetical protein
VLSVQRNLGLVEVPKTEKSPIVEEKTGGRRSRISREGASKGFLEAKKDLREVAKGDFKSKPLDLEGCLARDQHIIHSRSEKVESREERTREVQTHDSITVVDRKKNEDHRSSPKSFIDS